MLYVDNRWRGEHGIGRFATEVVKRLSPEWAPLGGQGSPTSPLDVVNPRRMQLSATDIVYSPGFNAGITRARQLLNIHDLIHLQIDSERSFSKTLYYNTVVRRAVIRAEVVMTDSQASALAITDWLGRTNVEIVNVGCGRSEEFTLAGDRVQFARPTFVYVGNFKPHKNTDMIFSAIALRPEYDLVVVTGDAEAAQSKVRALGLQRQVTVRTGIPDSDLATIYRGATGVLQPSLLEGFGLPALEAMSCGTRVAYWQDCASVAEICAGEGIAVESAKDAEEWATALDTLTTLSQPSNDLRMPEDWLARYTWDSVALKVSQTLLEAQNRG